MANLVFKEEKGILLAKIVGEVTLLQSNELKEKIKEELIKVDKKQLVLDLSEVPLVDSSGLGMLINLFKYINQEQGKIVYAGITEYVKKIIGFAKLDKIFTIVDDVESAVNILNV